MRVACHWWSFVIEFVASQQLVHGQCDFLSLVKHDITGNKIIGNSNSKTLSFFIHHGNTIFLVAMDPVCHFLLFQCFLSTFIHQGRLKRKRIIEILPDLMEKQLRQS
jgi:hypothetical protein